MGPRRRVASRLVAAVVGAVLIVAALAPGAALADGDPASDVLLGENVFYPYSPHVSAAAQKSLNALTAAAKKSGFPIKVALIASPVDLGVIPDLFGKPQKYAEFLDQEISFRGKQPLLVVMPAGYGTQGLSPKAVSAIAALPKPTKGNDGLATAASSAVTKAAQAAGHPITAGSGSGSSGKSGSGSSSTTIVIALAAAAVIAAGALAVLTLRRRRAGTAS
jgi:hypothetical protein